jgi:thioredoxin-related protein
MTAMKKIALSLLVCWVVWQVNAAEEDWLTDFSKARAQAKTDHKMVLMDFNGSDWCAPCKDLRKNVLSSPEFLEYAKKNLVLVDVDFPKHKELPAGQQQANDALAQKYGVEGFPTIVVLNSDGKEIKKSSGYDGQNAKQFIAELQKLQK